MNNIVAVNGSPKTKNGASAMFISQIEDFLETKITVYQAVKLARQEDISIALSDILKADTLLIVFPLYVDSLPAPLIKVLTLLEREVINTNGQLPKVYAICNCGFYEDRHNRLALNIIENFSVRSGMSWGGGVGIGGGEFVRMQARGLCRGSVANVFAALRELAELIQSGSVGKQNVFVSPRIPRFLYRLGGNMRWLYMAWKHGKAHSIKTRPHRP
ncbi:MAG: hypothetical protein FWH56_07345 [Betaproteobacteria bacterium]|nr:hypothetical protein [Betaproteobacteria bacterium]